MTDHTRPNHDDGPESESDRTPSEPWSGDLLGGCLGTQIDRLVSDGEVILSLALPWTAAVAGVLAQYEEAVAGLQLDDDTHRRVADAAGITELYDQVDALTDIANVIF